MAILRGFNAAPPGDRRAEDPDAVARLRALGYVSGSAPAKARYTDADDPKQLVDLDRAVHDAVEAFGAKRFGEAVQIYQGIIARRPDMAIAYRHLAFVEWQRGNPAGAVDALQRAIKAGVTEPAIVAQLGGYLTDTGRVAEAIRLLEPLTRDAAGPESGSESDSESGLGVRCRDAERARHRVHPRRPPRGRATFERVLAANPDSSVPLENLGVMALERGDLAGARRYFERAVRADPRSSRARGGLGVVALREGDRAGAIDAWTRAVQLDPANFDALYNAGTTLARDGQMDAARPYLELFLKTAPPAFYAKDLKEVEALLGSADYRVFVLELLKPFEIDRALRRGGMARDDEAQYEQRVRAADEDQFRANRIQEQRRRDVEQRGEQEGHREQRVGRRRARRPAERHRGMFPARARFLGFVEHLQVAADALDADVEREDRFEHRTPAGAAAAGSRQASMPARPWRSSRPPRPRRRRRRDTRVPSRVRGWWRGARCIRPVHGLSDSWGVILKSGARSR